MELQLQVFGSGSQEDQVWDAIMDTRKQISDCKAKKLEFDAIFSSAEIALQASGEAAHITGIICIRFRTHAKTVFFIKCIMMSFHT